MPSAMRTTGPARGHLRLLLHGARLRGRWSLVRMRPARERQES